MPSLTSILPAIAPVLELTPQALYERQRALIRLGLLAAPEGRGKVGAVASPDTVALLIVATMVTDNLSDTDDRVRRLSSAPFVDGKKDRCAFSGAIMFKEALSFVLSPTASLSRRRGGAFHTSVRVYRNEPAAQIMFGTSPKFKFSEFGERDRRRDRLRVEAELPNDALQAIRLALSNRGSS